MTETERPLMLGHLCTSLLLPIVDSTKHACVECRQLVWITPASLQIVRRDRCVILCVACALDALPEGDVGVQPLNEEQMKEFRDG